MLWHELERTGVRSLKEIDQGLSFAAAKACYLNWVRSGNPLHFLHSAPLQFGAFEPLRSAIETTFRANVHKFAYLIIFIYIYIIM